MTPKHIEKLFAGNLALRMKAPADYLRYSAQFTTSRYDLIAAATTLPPAEDDQCPIL
jgi:hypothetical protein